ncbi:MAG: alkaline phosphatase D family protein [Novosphingobium sp.]
MSMNPPEPAPITHTSRRTALKLAALGLSGAAVPVLAQAPTGFTHGVASGEPGPTRVLLWTRYVSGGETKLRWEVASDDQFSHVVAHGEALASPASDCCAKGYAAGLRPGTWYHYRFIAPDGSKSVTGRTRTLPQGKVDKFRMAVFSCSNFGFGWFNAYAHAAESGDFDLAMHLGDYYYEYKRGEYPSAKQTLEGRVLPLDEAATLATYRERHATYRGDPDLQRLHQLLPWVLMWDDHESANDSYRDGAENHDPKTEGSWTIRKAAARRAYREWLPVSDHDWGTYEIGQLATLFKLESRLTARTRQLDFGALVKGLPADQAESALRTFHDGTWRDPKHTLLGAGQEAWLASALKASVKARKPWQVIAQQVIMGSVAMGPDVLAGMPDNTPSYVKDRIVEDVAAGKADLPLNMDQWDGYPAARDRLFKSALNADANLVVLSGDSHNAWAFDLDRKGTRVGVEMAGTSVTSPGAEGSIRWMKPDEIARATVARNPQLKWCDMSQRGYMAVELTPAAATCEYRFLATVRQKSTALAGTKRMTVLAGQRKYTA